MKNAGRRGYLLTLTLKIVVFKASLWFTVYYGIKGAANPQDWKGRGNIANIF